MPAPLRLALIGAGHMGAHHARAVAERDDARLVAVCDTDAARARAVAGEHGAEAVTSVADLAGRIDAAVVAASTSAHRAVALALAEQGTPMLIEKPLAGTARDGRDIVRAVRDAGVVAQVGHILRFDPVTRVVAGRRLRPSYIEVLWVAPFSFRSMDVGVVMDVLIHGLDVVLALAGEMPDRVDAVGGVVVGPHEDFVNVRLGFPGGCVATLSASRMSRSRQRLVRVFAPGAYLKMDYGERRVELLRPSPDLRRRLEEGTLAGADMDALVSTESIPVEAQPDALRAQLAAFLDAVRTGTEPAVTVEDGLRAVELAERILAEIRPSAN
ncbi:MAG: Gfo/Idh/MocA family oxidoreductase [Planctomycetes bacterium]|nr:Gfo/Idh/MocA family oxidoreductase [Planctomycetota bacterium]